MKYKGIIFINYCIVNEGLFKNFPNGYSFFILPSGYAIITFDFIFMKDRSPLCYFDNNVN